MKDIYCFITVMLAIVNNFSQCCAVYNTFSICVYGVKISKHEMSLIIFNEIWASNVKIRKFLLSNMLINLKFHIQGLCLFYFIQQSTETVVLSTRTIELNVQAFYWWFTLSIQFIQKIHAADVLYMYIQNRILTDLRLIFSRE